MKNALSKLMVVPASVTNARLYRRRLWTVNLSALVLVVMTVVAAVLPAPYVVESPGPSLNVLGEYEGKDIVSVENRDGAASEGELRMTTVSVQGSPGYDIPLAGVMSAWFDRDRSIMPVEALYPDDTDAEDNSLMNTVEMNGSQQEAIAAALAKQGISYSTTTIVAGVRSDGAAANRLEPGDVVLTVNGQQVTDVASAGEAIGRTPRGQKVNVTVRRKGEEKSFALTPRYEGERALVGIVLSRGFEFPVKVNFALDGIGGPSAGMIFALAIYDEMTPGDLTGGKKIAGTGTIDEQGTVGPIGGIRQKMIGARSDGAEYFLAPAANCDEVTGHIPEGLQVVKIDSLSDAINSVEQIASTGSIKGLPTCG
ncbi:PDZ domain-containing protein [Dermabacter hominis]|uniref:YlbL family protein n=1 Tax=Dermabacter hominis TaxID=36740 RepID=UPI0021A4FE94|nr:PDZ domain-containing protein [Dermabacter hominis]MCT1806982.1 PDZ domain-containing protein [Dermabacter hominis]MCT1955350.1 PDZ domain-containing protein [Dermabacter hominis]MDU4692545.1 PDZ domain-containing protein [Dermabacter sp.]